MDESHNNEERRRSIRLDMEEAQVKLEYTNERGDDITETLTCKDFAKSGIAIVHDTPIPVGTEVKVTFLNLNKVQLAFTGVVSRNDPAHAQGHLVVIQLPYDFDE